MRTALIMALIAAPGWAMAFGWECTYETYCGEDRSCGPTDLVLKITPEPDAEDLNAFQLETGGRLLRVRQIVDPSREARAYVTGMEFNTIHLISVFKNGTSRYTSHTPVFGSQLQSFLGTCEPS